MNFDKVDWVNVNSAYSGYQNMQSSSAMQRVGGIAQVISTLMALAA